MMIDGPVTHLLETIARADDEGADAYFTFITKVLVSTLVNPGTNNLLFPVNLTKPFPRKV